MESGVYSIVCTETGKVYIGSTGSFVKRFKSHRFHLGRGDHRNRHLQRAWDKYGSEAFSFSVIERVPLFNLLEREQVWLDKTENKFNILPLAGATRGVKRSAETLAKMSAANKGQVPTPECIAAGVASRVGKKLSDETRARMSMAHRGKKRGPLSDEHRAAIAAAQRGKSRVFTEQHCEALRKSSTGRVMSEESKIKMSAAKKGVKKVFTEQHKANIKAAWLRRKQQDVTL